MSGRLLDEEGEPLCGWSVTAGDRQFGSHVFSGTATTDSRGEFWNVGWTKDAVEITATSPGGSAAWVSPDRCTVGARALQVTACTIFVAGRAQTEDGGPVTGALVRLRSAEAGDDELRRVSVDGRFEFVHPKLRGPFEVIAELPGYAPARYAPCGLGSSEVFLQLVRPTSVIEGHLLDARGEAVAFQWIRFVPVDGGMNVAVMTSSEGRFRTDGVRDVDYDAILVRAEGVSSPMRRTHGGDLQIELRLPR